MTALEELEKALQGMAELSASIELINGTNEEMRVRLDRLDDQVAALREKRT